MLIGTDSDLFDLLQRLFGCGEWDEVEPWWRWRQTEVSKIKRSRLARNVAVADLATAAMYCKAHNIDIRNFTWLYKHILAALRWQTRQDQLTAQRYLADELQRAQRVEYAVMTDPAGMQDSYWYQRLSSAEDVAFVLCEWKAAGRDPDAHHD